MLQGWTLGQYHSVIQAARGDSKVLVTVVAGHWTAGDRHQNYMLYMTH